MVDIKDWSADVGLLYYNNVLSLPAVQMRASTSIAFGVNYWNLTNSHWEPVIEPWTVSADVRVLLVPGGEAQIVHRSQTRRLEDSLQISPPTKGLK